MKKILIITAFMIAFPLSLSAKSVRGVDLCGNQGELSFSFDVPSYYSQTLEGNESRLFLTGPNVSYSGQTGYPRLPVMTYTFALPPGSELEGVEFSGTRKPVSGELIIEATLPPMSLSPSNPQDQELMQQFEEIKKRVYSGFEEIPTQLGEIHSKGERREYSLVTVTLYPFFYDPVSSTLSVADQIDLKVSYRQTDAEHAEFIGKFLEEGTVNPDVPSHIYNKEQARQWYRPDERLLDGPRMVILTTNATKTSSDAKLGWYGEWRGNSGFSWTEFVTVEEIEASTEGVDLAQKIRNWLRAHASGYEYLLIVGHHDDIPMRTLTPYNNNCKTNDPSITPNPSDVYYGDLSNADNKSWNLDGDAYYGEVMSLATFYVPQDEPDMEMDIHVGRINTSDASKVGNILERIWLFEYDNTADYKEASVLAGGWLWFPNWNGSGVPGFDAAYYMEYLMNTSVVKRSKATTLYEEAGLMPSSHSSDLPLTNSNLLDELKKDVGIFIENNHGFDKTFARCVWASDDGDEIPEDNEFSWPEGLKTNDVWVLDQGKANVAFLLSCLNGKPEADPCLAQALLNFGSVAVVAHTRSALGDHYWTDHTASGQNTLYYHVLDNYLKKSATNDYILGPAVDAGRLEYFNSEQSTRSRFINSYGHVIFGDPALRHQGRVGALPEGITELKPMFAPATLEVDFDSKVSFSLPFETKVTIEIWDAAGRRVETLASGLFAAGSHIIPWNTENLSLGSYFITLRTADNLTVTTKTVVLN